MILGLPFVTGTSANDLALVALIFLHCARRNFDFCVFLFFSFAIVSLIAIAVDESI